MNIKPQQAGALLLPQRNKDRAHIYESKANPNALFQIVEIDLSVARPFAAPYVIGFPFKTLYAETMSNGVEIKFMPNTRSSGQQPLLVNRRDVLRFENPISGGFISHEAYPGETIRLALFLESDFTSGTILSQNSGGVTISSGSSFNAPTTLSIVGAAPAVELLPANTDRNTATIENHSGGPIYLGDSTVDATTNRGLMVPNGGYFQWGNTSALYVFSVAGGDITYLEEEN